MHPIYPRIQSLKPQLLKIQFDTNMLQQCILSTHASIIVSLWKIWAKQYHKTFQQGSPVPWTWQQRPHYGWPRPYAVPPRSTRGRSPYFGCHRWVRQKNILSESIYTQSLLSKVYPGSSSSPMPFQTWTLYIISPRASSSVVTRA